VTLITDIPTTQTQNYGVPQAPSTPRKNRASLGMTKFLEMRTEHIYYVYMLQSSSRRALYIGMTSNINRRVYQHKIKEFRGFTFDYDAVRLVYWESYDDVHKAIGREKQLKRWRREKKLWLIAHTNPEFRDLSADWYGKEVMKEKEVMKDREA
jgi:putative endonuclease